MNVQPSTAALSPDAEMLFRRVLRGLPATLEEHAGDIGWSLTRAATRLDELIQLRLIRRGADGILRADDPRASLGRLIDNEEASLDMRRRQLLDLRSAIASFETDYRRGLQLTGPRVPPWEEVAPSQLAEVMEHLARHSRGPLLRVVTSVVSPLGALSPLLTPGNGEAAEEGREQRTVLPVEALSEPRWVEISQHRAAAGERHRYLGSATLDFVVFGRAGVLLAEGKQGEDGYLAIRPPVLIDSFTALFSALWQRAEAVGDGSGMPRDIKLLELLALGFKDEAIARYLGLSLRTVRRRVSTLMDEHGVDTRFQLGVTATRRGLLTEVERR